MKLRIDPVACDGLGMCAHLAPDVIQLDPWGYAIFDNEELTGEEAAQARRAIKGCPRKALYADLHG